MALHPGSFLFVTLDSCRYDTFAAASTPNFDRIGKAHCAMAPANFTYASHAAMFVGFTPSISAVNEPFLNPKVGRIFRMAYPRPLYSRKDFVSLEGANIIEGFAALGYETIGSGAVAWFDPEAATTKVLTASFNKFFYPGNVWSLRRQVEFVQRELDQLNAAVPAFVFINVGETHVPYYHEGATWSSDTNPCKPFADTNDASECRRRQTACLEWVDDVLSDLVGRFAHANTLVCGDHGDAWGEDGVWEHSVHHEKVLEVPLLFRLQNAPASAEHSSLRP